MSIVILAAGQGTRMRSKLPKVLQPLAGKPLLEHVIATAESLHPKKISVVYGHGGEAVQEHFEGRGAQWVLQEPQLGTGHAVQQALPYLEDDEVAVILYGDVPLVKPQTIQTLADAALEGPAILTVIESDPTGYGRIVRDSSGAVSAIVEHKEATQEQLAITEVNTGLLACPVKQIRPWLETLRSDNAQGEFYLTDVVASAVAGGVPVAAVTGDSATEVMGINDKVQLSLAERAYQQRAVEALMTSGVTVIDPARVDIRGSLECGSDVTIDINAVFIGDVTLGDNVRVGPNCVIENSRVEANTRIHANCVLEDAVVGMNCNIGPFGRLRPGAEMKEGGRIGNFVEIKNTTLGVGSKANHLTYLGDATIGNNVNVGCGSITCNYDGANKHETIIGDNAFIGSGVEMVAPVEIGAGATIGAGSTIGKNAPKDTLTLQRSKQVTIEGWNRPRKKE
ncbi:MAG: UDP-N-acetylglucosamine diphosphorylase/glucosamine-1-phosphate N-acetyltransferase [Gammaproteobacteria bacterium]|nr:UDP-N-acetylglucosamine diphosphorylase/glucosamine-1-phosphate N-acetyltransferase [Gammaproteobacteria bacterium]MCP4090168.1 UDP-N-acetylglucosamine diphosphorylase/glucosamine-1-phosphate N-acetyltransferase [Gammaproteobacteria bacterium]MCP4277938.1 UDP-N-acetylglucosamine diphosphorylase/glucosamine-1-phosphate N-acetyltransferase [Gammaproteobacteria bacterium]MCP4832533.1 UDP-N-acetylglucosamine diphosphorylase/glucosamine-1-phosphate N-acetyltransferase [Gammaproteobacteria bacteriu